MRSRWSAELALSWLAAATMEGSWLALLYVTLQWIKQANGLPLSILPFVLAVFAGMVIARSGRHLSQSRYAVVLTSSAMIAAFIAVLLSGVPTSDVGAFARYAIVEPGAWLVGIAVLRGAAHGEPGTGYSTERVFSYGVPGLVVFWLLASMSGLTGNEEFATAGFTSTLSFISAGLLSLGLSRLSDLDVDAVDRAARRRWLLIVLGVVALVLVIGIPLSAVLGLPISTAVAGVLGPLAPVLVAIFYLMSVPIFALLDLIARLFQSSAVHPEPPLFSPIPQPTNLPPLIEHPTSAPPDLTWVLLALFVVGIIVLLRLVALFLARPEVGDAASDAVEVRASEPIVLPHLPHIPRPHLPVRRATPRTAIEAYRLSLVALDGTPVARRTGETPREHAVRILDTVVGRDVGRLATDYQLGEFAGARITASESRRAIERWRRVVRLRPKRERGP